jgi:hypothetical protein
VNRSFRSSLAAVRTRSSPGETLARLGVPRVLVCPVLSSGDLIAPEDQPRLQAYEQAMRQALHSSMLWAAE